MSKFDNWPENLPREDLIRLLRGFSTECFKIEQVLAATMPELYPLGDGVNVPSDQRVVVDATAMSLAVDVVEEIKRLRALLEE